jgi:hypothetical protein
LKERAVIPSRFSRASAALHTGGRLAAGIFGLGIAGYATSAGVTWVRYGHVTPGIADGSADPLLDTFMPASEVMERHHIRVDAPADVTLAAAREQELLRAPIVRSVFKARELVLGSTPSQRPMPAGILAQTLSMGWRILAEEPGRAVVVGAVTRPWEANVTFRGLPPEEFAVFEEPAYVKIVWSLRADSLDANHSIFRTETRAVATDSEARTRFRVYWSLASPGIRLIRRLSLRPLKAAAERRYELTTSVTQ